MAAGFYTPSAIDEMPFCDVLALLSLWRQQPPLAEIAAALVGLGKVPAGPPGDPSNVGSLLTRAPGGRLTVDG